MEYAVVRFSDNDTVSEVPGSWLQIIDGNMQCWWPGASSNLNSLIEEKAAPDARNWELCDVAIEKYCENLRTARIAATIIVDIAPSKVEMEYAVVRFTEDDAVSEVPISWLHIKGGISQCWWPNPAIKNVSSLITKKTNPDKNSWGLCFVGVEKYSNLKKARNTAYDIEHVTTDDEKLGKGCRKPIPKKFSDSSDTEDEENDPPKKLKKSLARNVKQEKESSHKPTSVLVKTATLKAKYSADPKKHQPSLITNPPELIIDVATLPVIVNNGNLNETALQSSPLKVQNQQAANCKTSNDEWRNNFDLNFNPHLEHASSNDDEDQNAQRKDSDTTNNCANSVKKPTGAKESSKHDSGLLSSKKSNTVIGAQACCCPCAERCEVIIRMIASLQVDVKGLNEKLKRHEPRRNENNETSDTRLIKQLLPLNDVASIEDFEKLLATSGEAKSQFKAFIVRINGKTAKEMIERVLAKVFSTLVASMVTWKGVGKNFTLLKL